MAFPYIGFPKAQALCHFDYGIPQTVIANDPTVVDQFATVGYVNTIGNNLLTSSDTFAFGKNDFGRVTIESAPTSDLSVISNGVGDLDISSNAGIQLQPATLTTNVGPLLVTTNLAVTGGTTCTGGLTSLSSNIMSSLSLSGALTQTSGSGLSTFSGPITFNGVIQETANVFSSAGLTTGTNASPGGGIYNSVSGHGTIVQDASATCFINVDSSGGTFGINAVSGLGAAFVGQNIVQITSNSNNIQLSAPSGQVQSQGSRIKTDAQLAIEMSASGNTGIDDFLIHTIGSSSELHFHSEGFHICESDTGDIDHIAHAGACNIASASASVIQTSSNTGSSDLLIQGTGAASQVTISAPNLSINASTSLVIAATACTFDSTGSANLLIENTGASSGIQISAPAGAITLTPKAGVSNGLILQNLPTSSAGLAAGHVYRNGVGSPVALFIV